MTTHHMSHTLTYKTWKRMINRCRNINSPDYKDYGDRGIKVCDKWLNFENFLKDMGEKPVHKSIDRIDNNKDYKPDNCRWSNTVEQARNKRNNHYITYNNITKCLSEWSEITGIKQSTIRMRLSNYKYTIAEALGFQRKRRKYVACSKTKKGRKEKRLP